MLRYDENQIIIQQSLSIVDKFIYVILSFVKSKIGFSINQLKGIKLKKF